MGTVCKEPSIECKESIEVRIMRDLFCFRGEKLTERGECHGVIPRAIQDLFQRISAKEQENQKLLFTVFVSSLLLHCESFFDLL